MNHMPADLRFGHLGIAVGGIDTALEATDADTGALIPLGQTAYVDNREP